MLYLSPQTTFTKEQIYEKIWHEPANDHLHAVENTIFQIRKKLKPHCKGLSDINNQRRSIFLSCSGAGFRFVFRSDVL